MPLSLSRDEAWRMAAIYSVIVSVTVGAFFASFVIGSSSLVLAGLGIAAYVFGLRHGFDADHIAAIDNTTRKLMRKGERPTTVGLWFSLGHSTVVIVLILVLVFATRELLQSLPGLKEFGAVAGTTISGVFLWLIGAINLVAMLQVYRIFRGVRSGELDESKLEETLANRGLFNRFFGATFKVVNRPWQMYPIGILFGLGFDTASEVALIAISVGLGVTSSVPIWMLLVLPLLFTCGMTLVDTSDGVMMALTYSWAFANPVRKVYYNLTVTLASVLVALVIGAVEVLQVLGTELKLTGAFWGWLDGLDFEVMGTGIVCVFIMCWVGAMVLYKIKRFDERPLPLQTRHE